MKKMVTAALCVWLASKTAFADQVIQGRGAEEIVRRGEILYYDAEVNNFSVWRHFLVEYDRRLYSCVNHLYDDIFWQCTLAEND